MTVYLSRDEMLARYGSHVKARRALGHFPVPTVAQLAKQGLARQVPAGRGGTAWQITPKGQELINKAMRHNGRIRPILPPDYKHPINKAATPTHEEGLEP